MFEDGWVGPDSFFKLAPSHPGQVVYFKGYVPDTPQYRERGLDLTISINDKPTEVVNLRSGEFTLTRLVREPADVTTVRLQFSGSMPYGEQDTRHLSAFVREISIGDLPDFASFREIRNRSGEGFKLEGVDDDGWIGRSAQFAAPLFSEFKVLKIDLEMPGWAALDQNRLTLSIDGQRYSVDAVRKGSYFSAFLPLPGGQAHRVRLEASDEFALPDGKRQRSFLIKNLSFENLTQTDLFARGWHRSGYLFSLQNVDQDGWVERQATLRFPATTQAKQAYVEVVRYPSRTDYPLTVTTAGQAATHPLGLEKTERLVIPLSPTGTTEVNLASDRVYELSKGDPRQRSFRIVNIDFD